MAPTGKSAPKGKWGKKKKNKRVLFGIFLFLALDMK